MVFIVTAMLYCLTSIGLWYMFYRLSANSRIKKAKQQGIQANLTPCRITYLVAGIMGQAIFWIMICLLSKWKGFN